MIRLSFLPAVLSFLATSPAHSQSLKQKLQQQEAAGAREASRCLAVKNKAQYYRYDYGHDAIYVDPNGNMQGYVDGMMGRSCNYNLGKVGVVQSFGGYANSRCSRNAGSWYVAGFSEYVQEEEGLALYVQSNEYYCNGSLKSEGRVERRLVYTLLESE